MLTFGRPLLTALSEFNAVGRPKESEEEISLEERRFLVDNTLTLSQMAQDVLLNQWHSLSNWLYIMTFDQSAREELVAALEPAIAAHAADFLAKSTRPYHPTLFKVLKDTYVPVFIKRVRSSSGDLHILIEDYQ